ncbi:aluminum-activated malate transporter [Tanacetum coccineum]
MKIIKNKCYMIEDEDCICVVIEDVVFSVSVDVERVLGLTRGPVDVDDDDDQSNKKYNQQLIHSFKVGFALVLVSLLYILDPLFEQVGENAMWAIMTIEVIFEFFAGATLSKGLLRGIGTILGGGLGCLAKFLANDMGKTGNTLTHLSLWASDELLYLTSSKFNELACCIEECIEAYFSMDCQRESHLIVNVNSCKSVLHSESSDESLPSTKMREAIKEPCKNVGSLLGLVMRELGESIMKKKKSQVMVPELKSLKLQLMLLSTAKTIEDLAIANFLFLLMEIVDKVEVLAKEVETLGAVAGFPSPKGKVLMNCSALIRHFQLPQAATDYIVDGAVAVTVVKVLA